MMEDEGVIISLIDSGVVRMYSVNRYLLNYTQRW